MAEQEQSMTRILETIRDMIDKGDDTRDGDDPTEPEAAGTSLEASDDDGLTGTADEAPLRVDNDELISDRARLAVEGSVKSLVEASRYHPQPVAGRAEVIEAMVMEHLGPVLRGWLDEHLPGIVERIVEREVRALIRQAGGS